MISPCLWPPTSLQPLEEGIEQDFSNSNIQQIQRYWIDNAIDFLHEQLLQLLDLSHECGSVVNLLSCDNA